MSEDPKKGKVTFRKAGAVRSKPEAPACKLLWEEEKLIIECQSSEDVARVTAIVSKEGVHIRQVKIITEEEKPK